MSSSGTRQRPSPLQLGLGIVVVVAFLALLSGLVWPGWMLGHPIWGPWPAKSTPIAQPVAAPKVEPTKVVSPTVMPCPCTTPAAISTTLVVTEPIQLKDMEDYIKYPAMAKYKLGSAYYCVAIGKGISLPAGHTLIELWARAEGDGNYLHSGGQYSMAAFASDDPVAKHFAPAGTKWTTGLLEQDGFHEAKFPLK